MAGAQSALGAWKKDAYEASSSVLKLPGQEARGLSTSLHDTPGTNQKGMLLPSGELVWSTLHSCWYDKDKNLCLHFCHPSFQLQLKIGMWESWKQAW